MGKQSARLWFEGHDHKDIVFGGFRHRKMYVGGTLVWEKLYDHPLYSQFFMVRDVVSFCGEHPIDEYGARLVVNTDAIILKCAAFLTGSGSSYRRAFACTGTNITSAVYVPYLAYRGEIIYDGLTNSSISTFQLRQNTDGIYCYDRFETISANLADGNGNALTAYSVGVDTEHMRLFYDLSEMKSWLLS